MRMEFGRYCIQLLLSHQMPRYLAVMRSLRPESMKSVLLFEETSSIGLDLVEKISKFSWLSVFGPGR